MSEHKQAFYTYTILAEQIRSAHVIAAIQRLRSGTRHSFGEATKFKVVHEGNRFDPKAVVGLAYEEATGVLPLFSEMKGGPEGANKVLERLGFEVVEIEPLHDAGQDWTPQECRLLVGDYFDMLAAVLSGQPYNKAQHNRTLRQSVSRTRGAVERKHMNVSAVMVELALPYIDGYKPNVNRQELLVETVEAFLLEHPEFFDRPQITQRIEPVTPTILAIHHSADFFEDPPEMDIPAREAPAWKSRRGRRVDFATRDAMNRALGVLGERFTFELEQHRLREAGRDDLAAGVRWVAQTQGDGMGFDILSFDAVTGEEWWVEVKTTALPKYHPFLVTANELACSEAEPAKFHLYRVFDYGQLPRVFCLPGPLGQRCRLVATTYRAGPPFQVGGQMHQ